MYLKTSFIDRMSEGRGWPKHVHSSCRLLQIIRVCEGRSNHSTSRQLNMVCGAQSCQLDLTVPAAARADQRKDRLDAVFSGAVYRWVLLKPSVQLNADDDGCYVKHRSIGTLPYRCIALLEYSKVSISTSAIPSTERPFFFSNSLTASTVLSI